MTQVKKQMVDEEMNQLGRITAKRQAVIEELVEDAAMEKANEMLKAFMASPVFNGTNAMVHAIEGLTAAINANTAAIKGQNTYKAQSDYDAAFENARRNFMPTALERQLLSLEIPNDVDLISPWQLISIRNRLNNVDMPSGSELHMEYVAPVKETITDAPVEEIIVVIEEPKKRARWNEEKFFVQLDAYIADGGNINKGYDFKSFCNGGYQWAVKHYNTGVDGRSGQKGMLWQSIIQAYLASK